ncbi:MAG: alkaline phosphatase, partial [Candidatus Brocadiales bacterium]
MDLWRYTNSPYTLIGCLILALLILPAYALALADADKNGARNIILFIGDGMGWAHVAAARDFAHGPAGELHMEKLEHSGYVSTFALHSLITDSSAAATAIATGHKTKRGVVSQSEQGEEYKTILEMAKEMGKSTGLVTTTEVTHATPAAFAAHEASRKKARAIAEDYLHRSQPDVIMGGGLRVWTPVPVKEARDMGYKVVYTKEELELLDTQQTAKLLGLFAPGHMSFAMNRRLDEPSLIEMSLKALGVLSAENPDGLFLMIEGGRIDHAGHDNDRIAVIYETVAFDETVGAVMEW